MRGVIVKKEDQAKILQAQAFKRKSRIECKTRVQYPESFRREYDRLAKEYMKVYEDILYSRLNDIYKCLNSRNDAPEDDTNGLAEIFRQIADDFNVKIGEFELYHRVQRIADSVHRWGSREWGRAIKKSLGIDIRQDFFKGRFYDRMIKKWAKDNTDLITRLPYSSIDRVKKVVQNLYGKGLTLKDLRSVIANSVGIDERYAQFLAVDQVAKLNCDIAKQQQTSIGVKRYKWSTSKDARVRKSHRVLHGKIFEWDNPPIVDEKRGRKCHPGQDYRCRCVAIPVFDKESLNIPVEAVDWDEVDKKTKERLVGNRYGR